MVELVSSSTSVRSLQWELAEGIGDQMQTILWCRSLPYSSCGGACICVLVHHALLRARRFAPVYHCARAFILRAGASARSHASFHTFMGAGVRACVRLSREQSSVRACSRAHVCVACASKRACVHASICTFVHACVGAWVCGCVYSFVCAFVRACQQDTRRRNM